MKISPMIKTVTCITYSALILLSIIILWCVFSSTVESFGSSSEKSSESCPSCPSAPSCPSSSPTEEDTPEDDTPDEILCPNAPDPVAQTSEWTTHGGEGCSYLNKKGEKKCNERHVVYDNGDMKWCEWKNDECIDGGSCGAGGGGGGGEGTCDAGDAGPILKVSMDWLRNEGEHNLETIGRLDYINGEHCGKCKEATSKEDCVTSYQVCGKGDGNRPLAQPCKWTDANGVSEMGF